MRNRFATRLSTPTRPGYRARQRRGTLYRLPPVNRLEALSGLGMATSTLFLYGTLKRGHPSNALIAGQEFLGEVQTAPHYRLYDSGPFPCLVEDRPRGVAVRGEIWRVDDGLLAKLD